MAAVVLFPAPLLPSEREVPRVLGIVAEQAMLVLRNAGLRGEVVDSAPHPTYLPGRVIWQDPVPGVAAPRGSVVSLTVSVGKPQVAVPDVRGLDLPLAQRLLRDAGIQVAQVDSVPSDFPAGVAAGTDPAAGDSVSAGSAVTLHLGKGTK